MATGVPLSATARTDIRDWLVEADEPLAGLQRRNGGDLPGPIMAPALLELVRKARAYRFKLARPIEARDEGDRVTAWVEVEPEADGDGCRIAISGWQSEPAAELTSHAERERQVAMARQVAELTARLGPSQEVLAVETDCPELSGLAAAMQGGLGRAWTDFVDLGGTFDVQPVHWRLLDGARLRPAGSLRDWRATLVPLGAGVPGDNGFELLLCAEQPLPEASAEGNAIAASATGRQRGPGIGLEIAPVLRQPVSRIIANAETIRTQMAGPLAEEYANYAADIASAGEHLLALIDDLTTLEMVEDEEFSPAPDHIDLADVARRAAGILGVRARERGITVDASALVHRHVIALRRAGVELARTADLLAGIGSSRSTAPPSRRCGQGRTAR
jgi:hypothetical protein